ncbi:MAG TPA: catalase family peroxidase [Steroidobacteraceae bacterium]|jgi:catalase|nr:catalase family peroxidase [Steroidobacteraceae bacterium]
MPTSNRTLPRLALIGAILGLIVLLFAWVGGYLTPSRISSDGLVDTLERATGKVYPGYRRAHSKGVCVSGHFTSTGAGLALSHASLFAAGDTAVIGRFSTNAGNPMAPDNAALFHALGLRFVLPHGEEWRMAIDHTPIFIVSNPRDFVDLQVANTPDPATGKPDPARLPAFVASHPETQRFLGLVKSTPVPSSFANGTYYSIHAFRFTNAQRETHLVRWQFEPQTPFAALDPAAMASLPPNFLFDELLTRMKGGPLQWHLILIAANPGDTTDNATVQWTGEHQRIDAGTLVLDQASTEATGACLGYNYDPTILPAGVAISDDPLLPARSAAYAESFTRRSIEIKDRAPDAITQEQQQGATP